MSEQTDKRTDVELINAFIEVLATVGFDISANNYDRLKIPHPSRRPIERHFGKSWAELKAMVDPNASATTHQYLVNQNKSLLKIIEKERDRKQAFLDTCLAAIDKVSIKPLAIPKKVETKENLEFHSLRSDAQVGQKTDPAFVQGISHYDVDTYLKRLNRWYEKILIFKHQDQGFLGLNKLIIYHLGDQVENEAIYAGQAFHIDLAVVDQVFTSVEAEASVLLSLATVFNEIEVFCVAGNHGRAGKPGDYNKRTNFDYIFYRCLKQWVTHQKNIKIFVSESPSMIVKNGDYNFVLNHGDAAVSWMGIPFYGLERLMRRLPDLYGMVIHYGLFGHHHQATNIADHIIVNGCMPGGSDLSINRMGLSSLPSQKIFYFHNKKGINRESNLYLDEQVKLKADEHGIYTKHT